MSEGFETKHCINTLYKYSSFPFLSFPTNPNDNPIPDYRTFLFSSVSPFLTEIDGQTDRGTFVAV